MTPRSPALEFRNHFTIMPFKFLYQAYDLALLVFIDMEMTLDVIDKSSLLDA